MEDDDEDDGMGPNYYPLGGAESGGDSSQSSGSDQWPDAEGWDSDSMSDTDDVSAGAANDSPDYCVSDSAGEEAASDAAQPPGPPGPDPSPHVVAAPETSSSSRRRSGRATTTLPPAVRRLLSRASRRYGQEAVGRDVKILWEAHDRSARPQWFWGTVKSFDRKGGQHLVLYPSALQLRGSGIAPPSASASRPFPVGGEQQWHALGELEVSKELEWGKQPARPRGGRRAARAARTANISMEVDEAAPAEEAVQATDAAAAEPSAAGDRDLPPPPPSVAEPSSSEAAPAEEMDSVTLLQQLREEQQKKVKASSYITAFLAKAAPDEPLERVRQQTKLDKLKRDEQKAEKECERLQQLVDRAVLMDDGVEATSADVVEKAVEEPALPKDAEDAAFAAAPMEVARAAGAGGQAAQSTALQPSQPQRRTTREDGDAQDGDARQPQPQQPQQPQQQASGGGEESGGRREEALEEDSEDDDLPLSSRLPAAQRTAVAQDAAALTPGTKLEYTHEEDPGSWFSMVVLADDGGETVRVKYCDFSGEKSVKRSHLRPPRPSTPREWHEALRPGDACEMWYKGGHYEVMVRKVVGTGTGKN